MPRDAVLPIRSAEKEDDLERAMAQRGRLTLGGAGLPPRRQRGTTRLVSTLRPAPAAGS